MDKELKEIRKWFISVNKIILIEIKIILKNRVEKYIIINL